MKKIITALCILLWSCVAQAGGSSPGLYYGQVPTAAQWNSYFAAKLDYTPGSINSTPYWDGSGNLLSAPVTGDCTAVANVFTCTKLSGVTATPIIASGFGTTPSVVSSHGASTFKINVGTGGTASSGVVTMPAATVGYNCTVTPSAAPQAAAVMYSAATNTTSITITNYTLTTGAALAWPASEIIAVNCVAY